MKRTAAKVLIYAALSSSLGLGCRSLGPPAAESAAGGSRREKMPAVLVRLPAIAGAVVAIVGSDRGAERIAPVTYHPTCAPLPELLPNAASKWDGEYYPVGDTHFLCPALLPLARGVPPPMVVEGGRFTIPRRVTSPRWLHRRGLSPSATSCGMGLAGPVCAQLCAQYGEPLLDFCSLTLSVKPSGELRRKTVDRQPLPPGFLTGLASQTEDTSYYGNLGGIEITANFARMTIFQWVGRAVAALHSLSFKGQNRQIGKCLYELRENGYREAPPLQNRLDCMPSCQRYYDDPSIADDICFSKCYASRPPNS